MASTSRWITGLLAAALVIVGACSDSPSEPPTPVVPTPGDSSLQVNSLAPAADAPAIANPVVTFYAKVGERREAFMYYRSRPGRADSTVFVRFRVSDGSLLTRPDGSVFAPGDSILITISLVDSLRGIVRFAPAGLRFSAADPADVKFSFLEKDEDLNDDGAVNAADSALQNLLSLWKRESPTLPWIRQTSTVTIGTHEIEADVTGFTEYIIGW